MKKQILLLAIFLLAILSVKSQTCLNATNFLNSSFSIPPPGTISPAGPALGCLTTTQRQVWYYLPVCQTISNGFQFQISYYSSFSNICSAGIVFYGPFNQKVSNCANIVASKILKCSEDNFITGNSMTYFNVNDTLFEGNYYYVLLTFSDSIYSSNILPLAVGSNYNCFECNNQPSVLYKNNLCLLSVDTAINKCTLTWEEFPATNLAGYNIMRESTFTGVYDSLTTIHVGSLSTYTDLTSSPVQRNYTYAVTAVDSCGQSYPVKYGSDLTSIHLLSFSGGNNQAQLIWNNIYAPASFIPQYYIYRNSNGSGWLLIDSIGTSLPTITYTDIFAPSGPNQYSVELRKLNPCIPMRTSSVPYQSVFSNVSNTTVTSVEELTNSTRISIYPNPARDKFTIDFRYLDNNSHSISITNMQGKKYFELKDFNGKSIVIENEDFKPGVYLVDIRGDKTYRSKIVFE